MNSETGRDGIQGLEGGDQPSDRQKDISSVGRKGRKTWYRSEELLSWEYKVVLILWDTYTASSYFLREVGGEIIC